MKSTRRKMSLLQLTFITAANMMGAGIIMLPTKLAEVGTISILSWLVTALGSLALSITFARCGMFSTKDGGMGGYSEYAFGRFGHFLASYAYAISIVIANVAIALSAIGYGAAFLGTVFSPIQTCVYTIALLWLTAVLNFNGSHYSGKLSSIAIWGSILPILILSICGWLWFSPTVWMAAWNPHHYPYSTAIGTSISLTLWSFLGLESAAVNMDAVENPQRSVPLATFFSTLGVAIIYIVSTNIISGIIPYHEIVSSHAPFGLVFTYMFGSLAGKLVMGMMVIACAGSLLSWQFTLARVFKTSAQRGLFPKIFAKVTRADVPIKGLLAILAIQSILSIASISPSLTKQFEMMANLAVVTNIIPYILCAAALRSIIKKEHPLRTVWTTRTTYALTTISIIYCLYALTTLSLVTCIGGGVALLTGWLIYIIRFALAKQRIMEINK